jgi:type IX secretion system PorP/SprF family membrane protein
MNRIRIILIASFLLLAAGVASGQQVPSLTQYVFNDYMYNPAIGGIYDYYQVKTNYRYQWAGIKDAPRTYMLSAYGPHKTMPMGYGGYIFSDVIGPTSKLAMYGSYAYNIRVSGDIRVSLGAFLGITQYKIDLSAVSLDNPDDPVLTENGASYTKFMPDASFGAYLYTSQYYGGVSVMQLFSNKIETVDSDVVDYKNISSRLNNHLVLMGGYKYNINRDFDVEAGSMIKLVKGSPIQVDINVRSIYQKMVWFGVNYRSGDAVSILAGYNYQDMLYLGLSYDITTSELRNYSSGTYEIMIGVKFNKIKQSSTNRKIR